MSKLIDRFDAEGVLEALLLQPLTRGQPELARAFASSGRIVPYEKGGVLTEQGAWDDDLHFILAGEFDVMINGQHKATRRAGEHVGDLAVLNRARARTATLRAVDDALVLTVSAADVKEVAGENAEFWKAMAEVAAQRLDQRNAEIGSTNDHPRVFVISSTAALPVARMIRQELHCDEISVLPWDNGIFTASTYPLSTLYAAIEGCDFTISVVRGDDALIQREKAVKVARDNVHLEYGISVGRLGIERSFLLVDVAEDVALPSDTAGLTTLRYKSSSSKADQRASIAKACDDIRDKIEFLGVRRDRRAC